MVMPVASNGCSIALISSSQDYSIISQVSFQKRSKKRNLPGKFSSQARDMNQTAAFEQIEKNLAIGPALVRGRDGPMNGLGKARMINKSPVFFGLTGCREDVLGRSTRGRGKQILYDQQG